MAQAKLMERFVPHSPYVYANNSAVTEGQRTEVRPVPLGATHRVHRLCLLTTLETFVDIRPLLTQRKRSLRGVK